MSEKLVFFDIDGTLLDHEKNLPNSSKEAIFSLQQQGVNVAIATGRAPFMYERLRDELNISTFVSYNGQYVVCDGEVVYTNPLDQSKLASLVEFAYEQKHPLVYMDANNMKSSAMNHPYIHESISSLKVDHPGYDPEYLLNREVYQTLLFCIEGEEGDYINTFPEFQFIRWHKYSTDIIPYGGSKAEGIKKIMNVMNIRRENVFAFGDGLNDLEMLEFVGTGVAMGNAAETVKRCADVITTPVDEDGIVNGLKRIGLL